MCGNRHTPTRRVAPFVARRRLEDPIRAPGAGCAKKIKRRTYTEQTVSGDARRAPAPPPDRPRRDAAPGARPNRAERAGAVADRHTQVATPRPGPRRAHANREDQDGPLQTVDTLYGRHTVWCRAPRASYFFLARPWPQLHTFAAASPSTLPASLARFASLSVTLCSSFHATTFFPACATP